MKGFGGTLHELIVKIRRKFKLLKVKLQKTMYLLYFESDIDGGWLEKITMRHAYGVVQQKGTKGRKMVRNRYFLAK